MICICTCGMYLRVPEGSIWRLPSNERYILKRMLRYSLSIKEYTGNKHATHTPGSYILLQAGLSRQGNCVHLDDQWAARTPCFMDYPQLGQGPRLPCPQDSRYAYNSIQPSRQESAQNQQRRHSRVFATPLRPPAQHQGS